MLKNIRVVPVAVFEDPNAALRTAEILMENSFPLLEITLRTPAAFDCIGALAKRFPDLLVGAGSVLSADALRKASDLGARFGVAPCLDAEVLSAASALGLPFVPGVATPSELNAALKSGLDLVKIFPASNLGGPAYIAAVTAPFKMYSYGLIPTGGVNEGNLAEYLKAPHVVACGASYFVDSALIGKGDYAAIRSRVARVKEILSA
jgi:2-dehydro-3-deoxyphosphogluconate aldolase/(4S)-4-hydroxy-2-oxoglutarate aldolase